MFIYIFIYERQSVGWYVKKKNTRLLAWRSKAALSQQSGDKQKKHWENVLNSSRMNPEGIPNESANFKTYSLCLKC